MEEQCSTASPEQRKSRYFLQGKDVSIKDSLLEIQMSSEEKSGATAFIPQDSFSQCVELLPTPS